MRIKRRMDIIRDLEAVEPLKDTSVTVGTFDGVHLGHRKIIEKLKESARIHRSRSVVVTFDPHPKEIIILPDKPPIKVLQTFGEKLDVLAELGVDVMVVIPFNDEFSKTPPAEFVKNMLVDKLGARSIIIGYDHSFGRNRSGNSETLQDLGEREGFTVRLVGPVEVDGVVVSSTLIRRTLADSGRVEEAAEYLGRNYTLSGTVVKGEGIGRSIDFPTANIEIIQSNKLLPLNGVYHVKVQIGDEELHGMMNIGVRPTFNGNARTVEIHLLSDTVEDLYHEKLRIEFLHRLRDEIRFDSTDELIAQLNKDKAACLSAEN